MCAMGCLCGVVCVYVCEVFVYGCVCVWNVGVRLFCVCVRCGVCDCVYSVVRCVWVLCVWCLCVSYFLCVVCVIW